MSSSIRCVAHRDQHRRRLQGARGRGQRRHGVSGAHRPNDRPRPAAGARRRVGARSGTALVHRRPPSRARLGRGPRHPARRLGPRDVAVAGAGRRHGAGGRARREPLHGRVSRRSGAGLQAASSANASCGPPAWCSNRAASGTPTTAAASTRRCATSSCRSAPPKTTTGAWTGCGIRSRRPRDELARIAVKLCRFDEDRLGCVEGDHVYDVTAALDVLPPVRWPVPLGDSLLLHLPALMDGGGSRARRRETHPAGPGSPARAR